MKNKVSMDDIANKLGISKNTVSMVFRNMPGISDSTRKQVYDIAMEMGYKYPKSRGQFPANEASSSGICLAMSSSTRDNKSFFSQVQFGIEASAREQRLSTSFFYFDEKEGFMELPSSITSGLISGIITLGRISRTAYSKLLSAQLPVVMVDNYFEGIPTNSILSDNFSGAYMAAAYLLREGHREIGFVGDISLSLSFYDRYAGYCKALNDAGIQLNRQSILHKSLETMSESDFSSVVDTVKSIPVLPSAFLCCNDIEAITLIKALNTLGVEIPSRVSVMGFDDIDNAKNIYPELTTMRVEKELMGKRAVQRLLSLMENQSFPPEKLAISVSLVERQSVGKRN